LTRTVIIIKKTLLQAFLIVLLSVLAGLGVGLPLVRRFVAGDFRQAFLSATELRRIRLITLEEAKDAFGAPDDFTFIDARPASKFKDGHIPGALGIPYEAAKTRLSEKVMAMSRQRHLVIYCEGGDCQSSLGLGKLLAAEGFEDVRVMMVGWSEWQQAGLPAETEHD